MANDISKPMNSPAPAPAFESRGALADLGEIDLRGVFELVASNKWPILVFGLVFLLGGLAYSVLATPTYVADGLVQVTDESKTAGLSATLSELSPLLMGGTMQTEAEVNILQSRMVLDQVIDKLGLLVEVTPRRFPIFGSAVARWNRNSATPVAGPFGLRSFAWGGEKVDVPTFEVSDELINKDFSIVSDGTGYILKDWRGNAVLGGHVGEMAVGEAAGGRVSIFVRVLSTAPGTVVNIVRRSRQDVLAALKKRMSVGEKGKQSGVIQISFSGNTPLEVAAVINNLEEAYLRQNVERRSVEAQQSLEFLNTQLPDLKQKVDTAEATLNRYQLQHGTVDVTEETSGVLHESVDLETRRLELMQQKQEALQRFTSQHPVVKALDDQIQTVEAALGKTKGKIEKLPTTQQDVLGLMRDLDVSTQLYTAMLDTVQQLQVAKAGTVGNVRIVDHALKPFKPSAPKLLVVSPAALLIGLFFGVAYVFLKRALIRGVDDPTQIERLFSLPTLGSIPFSTGQRRMARQMIRTDQLAGKSNFVLAASDEDATVTEALRSLRTSLHFLLMDSPSKTIMLTGPSPGLGKSFLSVNFAAVLALSGKKVAVVDADLRRGHVHKYFSLPASPGLADYLGNQVDYTALVRSTDIPGLSVISRGSISSNPSELLLGIPLRALIERLSSEFDYVVIDSPPVLPVTDAAIIGCLVGVTLLVLKAAENTVREVEETLKRLANARVTVNGVVLNQVGAKIGSYGYGNYGYSYYRYGNN